VIAGIERQNPFSPLMNAEEREMQRQIFLAANFAKTRESRKIRVHSR